MTNEQISEYNKKYYRENANTVKEKNRSYYLTHKKESVLRDRKWVKKNAMRSKHIKQACFARKKLMDQSMTVDVVQSVYEENINKYGTLTCVVCNNPIKFGDDTLEHDMPLVRGGTHDKANLGVAHRSCNTRKHNKTLNEYKNGGVSWLMESSQV